MISVEIFGRHRIQEVLEMSNHIKVRDRDDAYENFGGHMGLLITLKATYDPDSEQAKKEFGKALHRLKKLSQEEGILKELKRRKEFQTNTSRRREAMGRARSAEMKRRRMQREFG